MLLVTLRAPDPEVPAGSPTTLRQAVWLPFVGFLERHRALEILAFVLLYKLSDNLAEGLLRPFLNDRGYDAFARGIGLTAVTWAGTVAGAVAGGTLTSTWGLGRCLWTFGVLQIVTNVVYLVLATRPPSSLLLYTTMGIENVVKGMGMGAFGVLLLRLTEKRFSAAQYALFSSVFGLPRIVAGPIAGFFVHAAGWVPFFWFTMLMGIPGLVMLARFVHPRERDPRFDVKAPARGRPATTAALAIRGIVGGVAGTATALLVVVMLEQSGSALALVGSVVFGVACGLFTAAIAAARGGTE
jgi:PAT family beta-lactamase induction signal transducer AmpG